MEGPLEMPTGNGLAIGHLSRRVFGTQLPTTWCYGAVERAFRISAAQGDRCIFEPKLGTTFDSPEEAYVFYNMYSWERGFGIRFGRARVNMKKERSRQDIVCSCAGTGSKNCRSTTRSGCKARISLLKGDCNNWYVNSFAENHNHAMSVGYDQRRQWNSHNRIDQGTRDLVRNLRLNNVQISRVCSIVGSVHEENSYVPFSRQTVRSLCGRLAQESIEGDMGKTLELFKTMRLADPDIVVKMDLDHTGRVKTMFWCHGYSRMRYKSFGDIVTFDTTYRTNLYNLPFGLFVGANHHFQSVVFGAVLFTEETIEAFRWAFRVFSESMGGCQPQTILTDQCHQMRVAIAAEYPDTRHRWCKWHVLKKAKESLGGIYSKNNQFKIDLHELIDQFVTIEEFESSWRILVKKHGLADNKFMHRAYTNRAMWAKPYFTDTFCTGMTSTQRSESANHMLKTYISSGCPMHLFVSQYNRLIADRQVDEGREEHATLQVTRAMSIGVPIERNASKLYTRTMFKRFAAELFKSGSFSCIQDEENRNKFRCQLIASPGRTDFYSREFKVERTPDCSNYSCSCKNFEHTGMPCRHVLSVLVFLKESSLPSGLVMKRWTRNAICGDDLAYSEMEARMKIQTDMVSLHGIVYSSAMELVGMCKRNHASYEVAIDFLNKAKTAIFQMRSTTTQTDIHDQGRFVPAQVDPAADSCLAPPRVRSRGRMKTSRLKSVLESPGARRKKKGQGKGGAVQPVRRSPRSSCQAKCVTCGSPKQYSSKCPDNIVAGPSSSPGRKCKLCGEQGHNRKTCNRKNSK